MDNKISFFVRFSLTITILMSCGEIFTRLFIATPANSVPDREIGWIYKPGMEILHTSEGWAVNKINSMGFNDYEISDRHSKNHILVMGDSYTEALQVPKEENFVSLAESEANCIDFINAGRSGLSPIHFDALSERFLSAVQVNQIIIVLNVTDLRDLKKTKSEIIRDGSGLIVDISLREKELSEFRIALNTVLSNSALANYLKDRIKASIKTPASQLKNKPDTFKGDEKFVREILEYVFRKLKAKAPLAVVYLPDLEYLPNSEIKQVSESAYFEYIVRDLSYQNGISFSTAVEYMTQSYKTHNRPPVGFANKNMLTGHLNRYGHSAMKKTLMEVVNLKCG